jgi:ABC-type multidrug transport system fused ATPase/permease subunit
MSDWFYAQSGQQSGPVTFDQLKELARGGGLTAKDLVWTSTMKDWQSADKVEGLFNTVTQAQAPAPDPSNPYAAPQSAWNEPAPNSGGTLEEIAPGSDPIDVGACVSRGFELTKRNFSSIFLVGLTYIVVSVGAGMVFGLIDSLLGFGTTQTHWHAVDGHGFGKFQQTSGPFAAICGNVFSIFLSLGLVRIGLNLVSGKPVAVGQLFGEGRKLLPAIGASILFGLMALIGFILLIVPGIYIVLRYGQFMNAMVDRNLGVMDSLSYSSSITTNNRLNLFLLALLSIAIVIAGLLALVVGLIFAYPVVWMSWMAAFRWMQYGRRAVEDHPGTKTPLLSGV